MKAAVGDLRRRWTGLAQGRLGHDYIPPMLGQKGAAARQGTRRSLPEYQRDGMPMSSARSYDRFTQNRTLHISHISKVRNWTFRISHMRNWTLRISKVRNRAFRISQVRDRALRISLLAKYQAGHGARHSRRAASGADQARAASLEVGNFMREYVVFVS